jgi:hypothetical protein
MKKGLLLRGPFFIGHFLQLDENPDRRSPVSLSPEALRVGESQATPD